MLEEELSKHFKVAMITGDTSARERAEIFIQFQIEERLDVILAVKGQCPTVLQRQPPAWLYGSDLLHQTRHTNKRVTVSTDRVKRKTYTSTTCTRRQWKKTL